MGHVDTQVADGLEENATLSFSLRGCKGSFSPVVVLSLSVLIFPSLAVLMFQRLRNELPKFRNTELAAKTPNWPVLLRPQRVTSITRLANVIMSLL